MHLKVAKWIMRAIVVLVVGVMLTADDHIRRAWKTGAYDDERRKKGKSEKLLHRKRR